MDKPTNSISAAMTKKSRGKECDGFSCREAGFTLVEVLVAMAIFMVGVAGISTLAGTAINSSASSRELSQATNIAQDRLEALQSVPFATIQASDTSARADLQRTCSGPTGLASRPVYTCTATNNITLGSKVYTWGYDVTLIKIAALAGAPDPTVTNAIYKRIDMKVTWADSMTKTSKTLTMTTTYVRD